MAENFFKKIREYTAIKAIRGGLVMIIPILMVGSFALVLRSVSFEAYQNFISSFADGFLLDLFNFIYNSTFGILSVYMCFAISTSYTRESGNRAGSSYGAPLCSLACFFIFTGILNDGFTVSSLGTVGMFTALVTSLCASALYLAIFPHFKSFKVFSDGADVGFNRAVSSIIPIGITLLVFATTNFLITKLFGVSGFQQLFINMTNSLFRNIEESFFGGFLFVLLSSIFWFFGIHGSDVLEGVSQNLFVPAMDANVAAVASGNAPTEIFTKTFFDSFVLMGGCGAAICLLISLILFSRRKSNRRLAKLAALPMLFNINEIMIFGLPVIFNPIMLIPFIATPIVCFLTSYGAMALGLVPLTINQIEWTTPVIIGGYVATGSILGSVLQLVNIALGVMIYRPFIKMYDREKELAAKKRLSGLISTLQEAEKHNTGVMLTTLPGEYGDTAKMLVNELRDALSKHTITLFYQPQFNYAGECIGAEALLRWNHDVFGMVYPPLVIKLANEAGILQELEKEVFYIAEKHLEKYPNMLKGLKLSINITADSMHNSEFADFICGFKKTLPDGSPHICLEITEQTALLAGDSSDKTLLRFKNEGYLLAIDDFSMGYTSLKYLQNSCFDLVKLDGSLVRDINHNERSAEIVSSIIYLSKSLGFRVLAEYVENEEMKENLYAIGCTIYQGYLFSPAITYDEFEKKLADGVFRAATETPAKQ